MKAAQGRSHLTTSSSTRKRLRSEHSTTSIQPRLDRLVLAQSSLEINQAAPVR